MCLKKTHSARLKHISLLESRTSYNDYDHGIILQSLCQGYPVGSNNGRLVCSLSNSKKNNLEQINAKQICTKLFLTVTYFITNQSLLPVKENVTPSLF